MYSLNDRSTTHTARYTGKKLINLHIELNPVHSAI